MGISSANPHETSLIHLGDPSGLKSLLHTLNATVIPTGLGFRVLFFVLLENEQKLGVGVFVSMIYDAISCPYLPSFWFV